MKRFYKLVNAHTVPGGFCVHLDGKPVKTTTGEILLAGSQALADALVLEWAEQGEKIVPDSMPLTQILNTKIDRVRSQRGDIATQVLAYLDTDLLCYRAEHPPEVAKLQSERWDPWLLWFSIKFNATLATTTTLQALKQPDSAHKAVRAYVDALDEDHFTALQLATSLSGSIVLALAFVEDAISVPEIFEAAHAEEQHKAMLYNEEFYGTDPLQEKLQKNFQRDLMAAQNYLKLLNA